MEKYISIIGGGLAGIEAASYLASKGVRVKLYEMRPNPQAYAHHSDKLGELVCSNSLKSSKLDNAAGALKAEMKLLNSLLIESAEQNVVPSGNALSVDRQGFADYIDKKIRSNPLIEVIHQEITSIPEGIVILASGPLTSPSLAKTLAEKIGEEHLYFYDAAAPIVEKNSINFDIAYWKSRYDNGGEDYLNCPFNKEQFTKFYRELLLAKRVELKEFEKEIHFEGCMPIESIAKRGEKTLLFGPLKPVGLRQPDGTRPYAVVQLRQDDIKGELLNIVGFQTNLTFSEQKRVFSLIPGLENVNIVRYGVMHRNTYICAPKHLTPSMQTKNDPNLFIAGQLSGVEGYIESAVSGIIAGINAFRKLNDLPLINAPTTTITGALLHYICFTSPNNFQPMNANYGIINVIDKNKMATSLFALEEMEKWIKEHQI